MPIISLGDVNRDAMSLIPGAVCKEVVTGFPGGSYKENLCTVPGYGESFNADLITRPGGLQTFRADEAWINRTNGGTGIGEGAGELDYGGGSRYLGPPVPAPGLTHQANITPTPFISHDNRPGNDDANVLIPTGGVDSNASASNLTNKPNQSVPPRQQAGRVTIPAPVSIADAFKAGDIMQTIQSNVNVPWLGELPVWEILLGLGTVLLVMNHVNGKGNR